MIAIMSDSLIDDLSRMATRRVTLPRGRFLFHRDDPVADLFLVAAGSVELVRRQSNGDILVLQRAGPDAVVAEASVFSSRYHCDALATSKCALLALPANTVRQRFGHDPAFGMAWTVRLARELQDTRLRAEILSLKTVAERLDAWLGSRDNAMPAKGHWKNVAGEIGVSPEALYREIARRRSQKSSRRKA